MNFWCQNIQDKKYLRSCAKLSLNVLSRKLQKKIRLYVMDIGHIDDYLHLYLLVSFTVLFTWYFWRIIWNKQLIWAKLQSKLQLHLDPRQLKHPISTLYIKPLFPHSNSKLEFFSDKIEFLRYNDQISVTPWQFCSFVCQVAT